MRGTDWHSQFLSLLVVAGLSFGAGLSLGWAIWNSHSSETSLSSNDDPKSSTDTSAKSSSTSSEKTPVTPAATNAETAPPAQTPTGVWPARHLIVAVPGQWLSDETKAFLREVKPGGVVLRAENLANATQTLALVRDLKQTLGLGRQQFTDLPLVAIELDGGTRNGLGLVGSPDAATIGSSGDTELARKEGLRLAAACAERGISVVFAPVLDVYEPGSAMSTLATQAFGSEPGIVHTMGLAFAQGIMEGGVIAVAGHFPGYGAANYRAGSYSLVVSKDMTGLAETMFPFIEAVNKDVQGMLVGHVAVPVLDNKSPDRLASMSPLMLGTILRGRWGFDGVIVSDDISTTQMIGDITQGEAAVQALAAGCDTVLLLDSDEGRIRDVCDEISKAAADGRLTAANLDTSKRRLDAWQAWLNRSGQVPPQMPAITPPANTMVARTMSPETRQTTPPAPVNAASLPQAPLIEDVQPTPPVQTPAAEPAPIVAQQPEVTPPAETNVSNDPEPNPPAPETVQPAPAVVTPEIPATENTTPAPADTTTVVEQTTPDEPSTSEPAPAPEEAPAITPPADEVKDETTEVPPPSETPAEITPEPPAETAVVEQNTEPLVSEPAPVTPEPEATVVDETNTDVPSTEPEKADEESAPEVPPASDTTSPDTTQEAPATTHVVEKGDTLSGIAAHYGVTMADITKWNKLKDNNVRLGTKLVIHPRKSAEATVAEEEPAPAPVAEVAPTPEPVASVNADDLTTYKVQEGDTLMRIAGKFNTTPDKILSLNGLSNPNHVMLGQTLKVPK